MVVVITGNGLTVEDVVNVARNGARVEVHDGALDRMQACRDMVERKIASREIMYGINTGIGEFSEIVLDDQRIKDFQRYLVYNHAAGYGDPAPTEHVRGAMLARLNVLAHGCSGNRPVIAETLVRMLNEGVTPVVCEKGSVGASGDLASMSQIALVLMGEGEAFHRGDRLHGREAMERAGIPVIDLHARDGLACINGSNFLTAMDALTIHDAERFLKQAEIAAAMTLDALMTNMKPYDTRLHEARGFRGAVVSASNIGRVLEGGDIHSGALKVRVQDAYSMRSTPQVIGAARDALGYARRQVETELNGVGDNPVFFPEQDLYLSGANFQGTPVSLPMDMITNAITMVSVLSERRLNRLLNPALSVGLPAFLAEDPGFYSGLMLSQYTACMLVVEQRILSAPSSIQSIPAAADQEDFVSMGMNGALNARRVLENACAVIGIETIAAAQALDFRSHKKGDGVAAAHAAIRKVVDHLGEDRPLYPDNNAIARAVREHLILKAVEDEIGELTTY
ncbi:MAG: histidine ammonia-lyase [Thermoplasmata archaeon]|nr:histidine ammonia-lyase [Thermoplasmata archaeon]